MCFNFSYYSLHRLLVNFNDLIRLGPVGVYVYKLMWKYPGTWRALFCVSARYVCEENKDFCFYCFELIKFRFSVNFNKLQLSIYKQYNLNQNLKLFRLSKVIISNLDLSNVVLNRITLFCIFWNFNMMWHWFKIKPLVTGNCKFSFVFV